MVDEKIGLLRGVLDSNVLRQAFCSGLVISSAFLLDIGIDWWLLGCSRGRLEDRRQDFR